MRDSWTIGYTPNLVAGVWAGNSDNSPMYNITSTSISYRALRDFMIEASIADRENVRIGNEALVDMAGPAAALSPLGATHNLVVEFEPAEASVLADGGRHAEGCRCCQAKRKTSDRGRRRPCRLFDGLDPVAVNLNETVLFACAANIRPDFGQASVEFANLEIPDAHMNDARTGGHQQDAIGEIGILHPDRERSPHREANERHAPHSGDRYLPDERVGQ